MKETEVDLNFENLLIYLKQTRGFDFTSYKRSTLQRRVQKRLDTLEISDYGAYQDYLEVHQDEFKNLFNTILINVTSFMRDPDAWEFIEQEIIPKITANDGQPIRIWTAGCASGQEAFTIAMLLAEKLGPTEYRERVKIYATDIDEEALSQARSGLFTEKELESVPEHLQKKYFEAFNGRFCFDRELRRCVIFGQHDLIQDAPISRVDLLICRNALMYFNAEAQERIISRFHFALNETGFLFLGKAETLLTHTDIFAPVSLKDRIFAKVARGRFRTRPMMVPGGRAADTQSTELQKLTVSALDSIPFATLILDKEGKICVINERARTLFGLTYRDINKPFQDLEVSYRPVEIRSGLESVLAQRRPITHKDVVYITPNQDHVILEMRICPVIDVHGDLLGASVTAEDVTQYKRLQEDLISFNQELETAYEEVQSTNEELQTTNEELQSTVEELETTNEELQSTNEELETMNEEFQSSNEELETINVELRQRSIELNQANSFLESIMAGLREGVIVVDSELHVIGWNYQSEDLWGLRADEVQGKHLLNLDIGFPAEKLLQQVRHCLNGQQCDPLESETNNRRGKKVICKVTASPLMGPSKEVRGAILLSECTPIS